MPGSAIMTLSKSQDPVPWEVMRVDDVRDWTMWLCTPRSKRWFASNTWVDASESVLDEEQEGSSSGG